MITRCPKCNYKFIQMQPTRFYCARCNEYYLSAKRTKVWRIFGRKINNPFSRQILLVSEKEVTEMINNGTLKRVEEAK